MAESSLDRLSRIRDVRVRWLSYELRPQSNAPLTPEEERRLAAYRRKVEQSWPHVQAMAYSYGLAFGPRNSNSRSRLALEGAKVAEDAGLIQPYVRAVFHAHFSEGRNIGDLDVLAGLAASAGLDPAAFRSALEGRAMKPRVDREQALAFTYRLSGVPAFIVGRKYLLVGAQPLETLVDVVDRYLGDGFSTTGAG